MPTVRLLRATKNDSIGSGLAVPWLSHGSDVWPLLLFLFQGQLVQVDGVQADSRPAPGRVTDPLHVPHGAACYSGISTVFGMENERGLDSLDCLPV